MSLLRQMKRARLVLPEDLQRYVGKHLRADSVDSAALPIETIADLRAFQTLLTLGIRGGKAGVLRPGDPLRNMLKGFRVELLPDTRTDNGHLAVPRFIVHRQGKAA
jgi:hypothetical protein